jgi:hypothetical protein
VGDHPILFPQEEERRGAISNSIAFLTFQTGAQVGLAESRASLSSGIPSNSFPILFLRESTTHGEVVIDYSTPSLCSGRRK